MKKALLVIIALISFSNHSNSQELSFTGTVRDSLTAILLAYANIIVTDSLSRQYLSGTITNNPGFFSLNKTSVNQLILSVSSIGYQNKELFIDLNKVTEKFDILLAPGTINLEEITVSWKPLIEHNEEGDVALNIDQMGNVGELSLSDIITSIPGLSIDIDGNVLYGGYNNFTTLIDGQRMGSYYGGKPGFILTGIEARDINRIEVITEPNGRFGFYTPVINIIPKGDLRDIYYASAGIGTKSKYSANIDLSKRYKNFTFNPVIDYQNNSSYEEQNEERQFNNTQIDREISSINRNKHFKPEANFRLASKRNQNINLNVKYNKNDLEQNRRIIDSSTTNTNDFVENTTEAFSASASYYQRLTTGFHSYLSINANASYNTNNTNGTQLQEDDQIQNYRNLSERKNQTVFISLNHHSLVKKMALGISGRVDGNFTNQLANRQRYSSASNTWDYLNYYNDDRNTSRIESNLGIAVSRLIHRNRNASHYFKLQLNGFGRQESNKVIDEDKITSNFYYIQQSFKYRLSHKNNNELLLNVNNQIKPPSQVQLFQPLTYIDDYTLKKGNSSLEQSTYTTVFLSYGKSTNYITSSSGILNKGSNIEKMGYGIQFRGNSHLNEIIPEYVRNEDGLIVQTWKNANKSINTSLSANIDWNINPHTKLLGAITYNYGSFYTTARVEDKNWNGSICFCAQLPGQLTLDAKVSYNSKAVKYDMTTNSYYDLRADIHCLLLKKRLRLTLSATNLLAFNGLSQMYDDGNTIVFTKRFPESPIVWLKANFLLFSYYKQL